jgi:putative aldouronate transport system substrate-binding protein
MAITTGGAQYIINSPDINKDPYVLEFEKLSNTDLQIELLPHETYNESLALLLAGGELPDILQTKGINTPEVAPAVDAGVLRPLNELIEKYAPNLMAKVPKESWASAKVSKDGVIYGIPQENPVRNGTVVMMRKDWLDAVGMDKPVTVDEYIEVFRAFKEKDPNGNGQADEIPFSGRENFSHSFHFFGAYDVHPQTWEWTGEKLIPKFIKPEMKKALEVYRQLYAEKLLDNEIFTQPGTQWDAKITAQGIVGTWAHGTVWGDQWESRLKEAVPTGEVTIVPAPQGIEGKPGGVYAIGSTVSDFIWAIPRNVSDEKAIEIIKFFDWFYSDEAPKNFFLYGIEGKDYTVNADGSIKYNYPDNDTRYGEESMHQQWLKFTGPKYHLEDEAFIKGRNLGDVILEGIQVAAQEGLIDDGQDMPVLPTAQARPELMWKGLWLEFAAKVITGNESVDKFDAFVEDWRKRGGDQWIEEATEWYKNQEALIAKLPDWAQPK